MTTYADIATPATNIRYYQDATEKIHKKTTMILPEDDRNWFYQCIAELVQSAKARGSNPSRPELLEGRAHRNLNFKEWFIAYANPSKGAFRALFLDMTASVSDRSLERLWTILEMVPEKNREELIEDIGTLVLEAYEWGKQCEPHDGKTQILNELSTW